ncbi:hypothetical protein [Brunnivagina elsteri]|uniref:hypothetical protein n=1 Tax=Brunnivagina elsteri TaxID=1247191 RepID=UPI001FE4EEC8|nr:hypothetical protein [Calothrix elsteri]
MAIVSRSAFNPKVRKAQYHVVEAAVADLGYRLTFWEHLRFGLPVTGITLLLVYFWVASSDRNSSLKREKG